MRVPTLGAIRQRLAALPPFVQLFGTGFITAMSGYVVLGLVFDYPYTFGALYRMFLYHLEHPIPYVVLVSAVYAALGTLWLRSGPSPVLAERLLVSVAILLATIAISAGPAGMIWVYHDMCAGYFPPHDRMVAAFEQGFLDGLGIAPILVLSAIPMNVISIIVGIHMLLRLADEAA